MKPAAILLTPALATMPSEAQETREAIREDLLPLVLAFHGGGGNAAQMARMTRFTPLAARERFAVIYPEGIGENWNDGGEVARELESCRDLDGIRVIWEFFTRHATS